ncbi:ethanolamine ammonia-lyase subunit EutC [Pseudomonas nicosulfuronedens]|uniref:Ethanolamine ammonia-lyase small subunit n=1 Tax=Pseudomonas nicosulfuronedens TaxID=2571105 RepID=A0A5R9RA02_9PSED|nr:ethanolamine ammonia-lyase subunit EutC [Pseudomonas nicosulfuronedens]MDH1010326.1 ethanolamine ammonia-lyase subunit EutC [Pseudomonas nicosulfuronedens]MDH1980193.1 ethanolamine ammonia-lyase subunit EutC [Pseudomonas nicosulfuronedens]MDH2025561.1 ethanolamine ammonia-lyase subunit EutC [Pseudomonas nicosulfuronedens]TLX78962.1 ethanolamine ammonia-lyase subunit EutC [Pseudomonas nicosulfuronedens]
MDLIQNDPWDELRAHTSARIALGRVGSSLPTREVLKFGLAHAQARDAVHHPLDFEALQQSLTHEGFRVLRARSEAPDRQTYLLRPDLGRALHPDSQWQLKGEKLAAELVIVIADGLSSFAVQQHALPLLSALRERFVTDWQHTPVVLAEQGRVAIGDGIGEALGAKLALVLIGERPGLSSPDGLGLYLTWQPRVGRMDSERNCISNVRPQGLPYGLAAHKLAHLLQQALRLRVSGVRLKDDSDLPEAISLNRPAPDKV